MVRLPPGRWTTSPTPRQTQSVSATRPRTMAFCTPTLSARIFSRVPLVGTILLTLAIFRLEVPSNNAVQPVSKSQPVSITPSGLPKVHPRMVDVFSALRKPTTCWILTSVALLQGITPYNLRDVLGSGGLSSPGGNGFGLCADLRFPDGNVVILLGIEGRNTVF